MNTAYSIVMTSVFFIILPFVLGQIWRDLLTNQGFVFTFLSGFFTIFAIFELLGPIMIYFSVPVHVQVLVDSVVLSIIAFFTLLIKYKQICEQIRFKKICISYTKKDYIYLIMFLLLLFIQVYFAIFYDIGTWRSDDHMYTVYSSAAIYDDRFFYTGESFGGYWNGFPTRYALCGLFVFYTYAAVITGLGVSIIQHTVCCALFLLLSYGAFYLLSKVLFPKNENRDNRLIFMILTASAFLFGMYSHYSVSFRLLGVIWQGKGFLAVVMLPFLLAIYPKVIDLNYSWKSILFMVMVSLATISLTMGGIIALVVVPGFFTFFNLIETKRKQVLLYLLVVEVFPMIDVLVFKLIP